MLGQIKYAGDNDMLQAGAIGAGSGAALGSLISLLSPNRSIKRTLKGAGLGALGGAAVGAGSQTDAVKNLLAKLMKGKDPDGIDQPEVVQDPLDTAPKKLNPNNAALAGLFPFIGGGVHGALGEGGSKTHAAAGATGNTAGNILGSILSAKLSKGNPLLTSLGALGGGAAGSYGAAHAVNRFG